MTYHTQALWVLPGYVSYHPHFRARARVDTVRRFNA